uniref:Uncharacterized protein n=1 Tax=Mycena chlorophos TaxID=658473 RepID=A0ABQ0M8F3_MYCCL|nr:predicted protein [Mycena chlorophos]
MKKMQAHIRWRLEFDALIARDSPRSSKLTATSNDENATWFIPHPAAICRPRPPQNLEYPIQLPPDLVHDFVLNHLLLDPHFAAYPPSEQYQKTFWKWMVRNLEQHSAEEDVRSHVPSFGSSTND